MESLLFLFPQFNYMAPKEEAYFKMLGPEDLQAPKMKDDTSRQKDKERKSRLSLFLTKSGSHENVSPNKKTNTASTNISPEVALQWSDSFEELLKHSDGVESFSQFLRTEFSEENIEFWLACEEYKTIDTDTKLLSKAKYIFTIFIDSEAPKEINIDYNTKTAIQKVIAQPTKSCFEAAQMKVYSLMKKTPTPGSSTLTFICVSPGKKAQGPPCSADGHAPVYSTTGARPQLDLRPGSGSVYIAG